MIFGVSFNFGTVTAYSDFSNVKLILVLTGVSFPGGESRTFIAFLFLRI